MGVYVRADVFEGMHGRVSVSNGAYANVPRR